jgi:hypothetical protein
MYAKKAHKQSGIEVTVETVFGWVLARTSAGTSSILTRFFVILLSPPMKLRYSISIRRQLFLSKSFTIIILTTDAM